MRKFKKLMCFVLTLMMVLSPAASVWAGEAQTAALNASRVQAPGIRLNKTELNLYTDMANAKKKPQIKATVTGPDKVVTWTSDREDVVTVSGGVVTVVGAGEATITAAVGESLSADCAVRVTQSEISLNKADITLSTRGKAKAYKLIPTVVGSSKKVTWTTSDKTVATVKGGKVIAKKAGVATITAKANGVEETCEVNVIKDLIAFEHGDIEMYPEDTYKVVTNAGKSDVVELEIADEEVAVLDNRTVTAVAPGSTTISATFNGHTAVCNITVKPASLELSEKRVVLSKESKLNTKSVKATIGGHVKTAVWTTDDASIATVANGKIVAKGYGITKVHATANGITKDVEVRVQTTCKVPAGYKLVWSDEFNGDSLDESIWNYETHAPGWVNSELQSYVKSDENIYVKDGLLTIQATKDGDTYKSGRINTKDKKDVKYGRFVAGIKVPEGQGLWPAFWMMPTDESLYGQWPRCGEIDIMEILGHEPNKTYSTIHYGNPHKSTQVPYVLESGNFSDAFHEFAVDWEPGKITYYVDGAKILTMDDWFTKTEGFDEVAYPAPFDQPFYVILNLAVGGDWPHDPDETTDFENAKYEIDYVRVYQNAKGYNENVNKPEKEIVYREPDENGNYILNGDFSLDRIGEGESWEDKRAEGGVFDASIENEELLIQTENAGNVDYSVQIVQTGLPAKKGIEYEVSFDAYADEARDMNVCVTGPDNSFVRYLNDTKVELTTEPVRYTYSFIMDKESDPNARFEFNLGHMGSIAPVHIDNVVYKQKGGEEIVPGSEKKTLLPDGNYVYNGGFDVGQNRMKYWSAVGTKAAAAVVNQNNERYLKVQSKAKTLRPEEFVLTQEDLGIVGKKDLALTFTAYADAPKTLTAKIGDDISADFALTTEPQEFKYEFTTGEETDRPSLSFLLGLKGVTYLDNVAIRNSGLLVNGDFSADKIGWEPYCDSSASAQFNVDHINEPAAMAIDIQDTGDADWKIQLKQNNVKLIQNQWYKLSYKAKSTMDRKMMCAFQRDGSGDDDWTPYSSQKMIDLTSEYQEVEEYFQMKKPTDIKSILTFSMGAVGGSRITAAHTILIDDVNLEMVDESDVPKDPAGDEETEAAELLKDTKFETIGQADSCWESFVNSPAIARVSALDGEEVAIVVENPGEANWHVQFKQDNLPVEQGKTYTVSFDALSDVDRVIEYSLMTDEGADNTWLGGGAVSLSAGVKKFTTQEIPIEKPTGKKVRLVFSFGAIADTDTPAGTVKLSKPSVMAPADAERNLFEDPEFRRINEWVHWQPIWGDKATHTVEDGVLTLDITDLGSNDYDIQLKHKELNLEPGHCYKVTFDITSQVDRVVKTGVQGDAPGYAWYGGKDVSLSADSKENVEFTFTLGDEVTDVFAFYVSMGKIDATTQAGKIVIQNVKLVDITE